MIAVHLGPNHAICNSARNLTRFDLCYKHNPCCWEFCDDLELPCQAASLLCLSGRLSRDLPRGNPDLNNSTAGGKNDPAWVCHRSDTKAMPAYNSNSEDRSCGENFYTYIHIVLYIVLYTHIHIYMLALQNTRTQQVCD